MLWLGFKYQLIKLSIQDVPVLSASNKNIDTARELGLVIHSGLMMSDHVTAVCHSAYYQLHQLRMIVHSLSDDAKKTLVQSFVSCRLDYCNALLYDISGNLIQRYKTRRHGSSLVLPDAIISLWCSDSSTGCL